jgi:hypothetical protein
MQVMGDKDLFMNLTLVPDSTSAIEFTNVLVAELWNGSGTRKTPTLQFREAVGAIVGALLQSASRDRTAYVFRQRGKDRFKFEVIDYRPFKRATDQLEAAEYLTLHPGSDRGVATRYRARNKLLKLAEGCGVSLATWDTHYRELPRPATIPEPLVLKASSRSDYVKGRGRVKVTGASIPIDMSRKEPRALAQQVNEINQFIAPITISPPGKHRAFQRIFNQGDLPGYAWNKGGRLVSMGSSYQNAKKEQRADLVINGERTVEIDVRASHLTVLHALRDEAFDPSHDPYDIPGYPRFVVKRWVTATLGHDRYPSRWSPETKEDYAEEGLGTGNLQKDHPAKALAHKLLPYFPILEDWKDSPVRWGDLQYHESNAIVGAVHELATKHGVPALPVHDSIIVAEQHEALATDILRENFMRHVGTEPYLVTK